MATVNLTLEQLLSAVEQLSPAERKRLQREMARLEAPAAAAQPPNQMPRRHAKRMSQLLLKANSGALTHDEDVELNVLVDEFELRTLANAEALVQRKDETVVRSGGHRRSTKR